MMLKAVGNVRKANIGVTYKIDHVVPHGSFYLCTGPYGALPGRTVQNSSGAAEAFTSDSAAQSSIHQLIVITERSLATSPWHYSSICHHTQSVWIHTTSRILVKADSFREKPGPQITVLSLYIQNKFCSSETGAISKERGVVAPLLPTVFCRSFPVEFKARYNREVN